MNALLRFSAFPFLIFDWNITPEYFAIYSTLFDAHLEIQVQPTVVIFKRLLMVCSLYIQHPGWTCQVVDLRVEQVQRPGDAEVCDQVIPCTSSVPRHAPRLGSTRRRCRAAKILELARVPGSSAWRPRSKTKKNYNLFGSFWIMYIGS